MCIHAASKRRLHSLDYVLGLADDETHMAAAGRNGVHTFWIKLLLLVLPLLLQPSVQGLGLHALSIHPPSQGCHSQSRAINSTNQQSHHVHVQPPTYAATLRRC